MTRGHIHLLAALLLAIAPSASADATADNKDGSASPAQVAVLELFTSQGCSSCPPADALLGEFAKRDDIIALTFNVDYWDYLGWKDTLANPNYGARQRDYAKARGDGEVYTPQVVVNGIAHAVGNQEASIERSISKSLRMLDGNRVPLQLNAEDDTLTITVGAAPSGGQAKPATIWLALIKKEKTVAITRGENRDKTITYHRVVRNLTPVGRWTGEKLTIKLPKYHLKKNGADGCAALLQQDTAGPILAAAQIKRW